MIFFLHKIKRPAMQYSKKILQCLCIGALLFATACGPNDDKGASDTKNSGGEGAIDTTRMPNFDTVPHNPGSAGENNNDKDTGNLQNRQ
jgi:hypothetical protein